MSNILEELSKDLKAKKAVSFFERIIKDDPQFERYLEYLSEMETPQQEEEFDAVIKKPIYKRPTAPAESAGAGDEESATAGAFGG